MAAVPGPHDHQERADPEGRSRVISGIDPSTAALIATNFGVLVLALYQQWDIGTVIWIYWCQSVIIGFFQFFRILSLRHFTTDDTGEQCAGGADTEDPAAPRRFLCRSLRILPLRVPCFPLDGSPTGPGGPESRLLRRRPLLSQPRPLLRPQLPPGRRTAAEPRPGHHHPVRPDNSLAPRGRFQFSLPERFRPGAFMMLKTAADTVMHIAEHAEG